MLRGTASRVGGVSGPQYVHSWCQTCMRTTSRKWNGPFAELYFFFVKK